MWDFRLLELLSEIAAGRWLGLDSGVPWWQMPRPWCCASCRYFGWWERKCPWWTYGWHHSLLPFALLYIGTAIPGHDCRELEYSMVCQISSNFKESKGTGMFSSWLYQCAVPGQIIWGVKDKIYICIKLKLNHTSWMYIYSFILMEELCVIIAFMLLPSVSSYPYFVLMVGWLVSILCE